MLTLVTLGVLLIPVLRMVMSSGVGTSILVTGIIGLHGHVALYAVYRHVLPDMRALGHEEVAGRAWLTA